MSSHRDRVRKKRPFPEGGRKTGRGTSVEAQWFRLRAASAGRVSLGPGQGAEIPQAEQQKKNLVSP